MDRLKVTLAVVLGGGGMYEVQLNRHFEVIEIFFKKRKRLLINT